MEGVILDHWSHRAGSPCRSLIVPDGCRDVIARCAPGERSDWFVSPLDDRTREVRLEAHTSMQGFRLKPGVQLDEPKLLSLLQEPKLRAQDVIDRIHACSVLSASVSEALEGLATEKASVCNTAMQLGVSRRSLERLLVGATGRPPVFWLQLARVRKAARAIREGKALAEVALVYGFSDQAHMTRQLRRWLQITPTGLRQASFLYHALDQSGFC